MSKSVLVKVAVVGVISVITAFSRIGIVRVFLVLAILKSFKAFAGMIKVNNGLFEIRCVLVFGGHNKSLLYCLLFYITSVFLSTLLVYIHQKHISETGQLKLQPKLLKNVCKLF